MAFDLTSTPFDNIVMPRYDWEPWGDGSSDPGFGNLIDLFDEVVLAKEVPEKFGRWLANLLNVIEEMQDGSDI